MSRSLENYVEEQLFFCLRNFIDFEEVNINIEMTELRSTIEIYDNLIVSKIDIDLNIETNNQLFSISSIVISIESSIFQRINNSISNLIQAQLESQNTICLSCVEDIAKKEDIFVSIYKIEDFEYIFIFEILDSQIGTKNENVVFKFIYKYNN